MQFVGGGIQNHNCEDGAVFCQTVCAAALIIRLLAAWPNSNMNQLLTMTTLISLLTARRSQVRFPG